MRFVRAITTITATAAVLAVSCAEQETAVVEQPATAVKVTAVETADKETTAEYTGTLEGIEQAVLYAKIAETVQRIKVLEGEEVYPGRVLIELDKYGPTSNYVQTRSLLATSEKNFKRMESLFQQGAVSESQLDAARTEYEVNKASFEAARKLVDVESPIAGRVTSIPVSAGDYLSVGQELATVARTDRLKTTLRVNSEDVAAIRAGQRIPLQTVDGKNFTGTVTAVASSADPTTRKVDIEIEIDNSAGKLKPGLFVRGKITLQEFSDVIAIPRETVIEMSGETFVFIASGETAVKRPVELGQELNGSVIIKSGIKAGDSLIVSGQSYLDDGFKIRVIGSDNGR